MHLTTPRSGKDEIAFTPQSECDLPDSRAKRLGWLDAAKGLGIILVVYGHQLRAQIITGKIDPAWHASIQDSMIYSFHMPMFFFISGITIDQSFRKVSPSQFIRSRLITLVYPYLLWSLISLILVTIGQDYLNHHMNVGDVTTLLWKPVFQYWFLYVLFLCQLLAFFVGMRKKFIVILAIAALISPFKTLYSVLVEMIGSFPFFAAGILLSPYVLHATARCSLRSTAVFGMVSAALFLSLFFRGDLVGLSTPILRFILAGCGIATVLAFSVTIGALNRILTLLGSTSMAIFVLHTIVATAFRLALNALPSVNTNSVEMLVCSCAGLALPVLIYRLTSLFGLARIFGLGTGGPRRAASACR